MLCENENECEEIKIYRMLQHFSDAIKILKM